MARSGKNFVVPLVRSFETTEHSATFVLCAVFGMVDTKENMCFHFCDTYFHFITFVNFLSSKLPQFWSFCESSHLCSHVLVTVAEQKLRWANRVAAKAKNELDAARGACRQSGARIVDSQVVEWAHWRLAVGVSLQDMQPEL